MSKAPHFGFVLEYLKDIEAAKRFYVDVVGLAVERYHPTFVQFAIASDAPLDGGGEPELYWIVDDAEAAFRELSPRAQLSLPLTERPFGKVFGIRDPDGRPRYLIELSKNRPSRSVG